MNHVLFKGIGALLLTGLLIALAAPAALAQDGQVVTDVLLSFREKEDYGPDVAYNSHAGEYLVVWQTNSSIRGQRYAADGVPIGEGFPIGEASEYSDPPVVAYSLTGDCYLVVWQAGPIDSRDLYGQRVDGNGSLLGIPFPVRLGDHDTSSPDIATDGTDFYVVWMEAADDLKWAIFAQRVSVDGVVDGAYLVTGQDGVSRYHPAVAYNDTNDEYLVVFHYGDYGSPGAAIHARRMPSSGGPLNTEYTIASSDFAGDPALAATPWGATGGYVVVWSDKIGSPTHIYGRVVLAGSNNAFDGGPFGIGTTAGLQVDPAIARAPATGQFLVAWEDDRDDYLDGRNIYGQLLSDDANLIGPNQAISTQAGDQRHAALAGGQGPDQFLVAWSDSRLETQDVYGQWLASSGALLGSEFNVASDSDAQTAPAVGYNFTMDRYLAVWEDRSSGQAAIYGQEIGADGQPLEPPWAIEEDGHNNTFPAVVGVTVGRYGSYLVVWADDVEDQIEGRIVSGGSAGDLFVVPDSAGAARPCLAYQFTHNVLVAWDNGDDVRASALRETDGAALSPESTLVDGGPGWQSTCAATFDTDSSHVLVTWQDDSSGHLQIEGRLLDEEAMPLAAAFSVAGGDGIDRARPSVAFQPALVAAQAAGAVDAEYLVVYQTLAGGTENDIYGRRITPAGSPSGSELQIRTEPAGADQVGAVIAASPELELNYVIWVEHQTGGDHDLYGQWLDRTGAPIGTALPFFRYAGNQDLPRFAYNNRLQQGLVVWQDGRRGPNGDVYARLGTIDTEPPFASFTRDPTVGQLGDSFTLDATPSTDNLTPSGSLMVRWDWNSDGTWDTAWSLQKIQTITPPAAGVYNLTLAVRDLMWQEATATQPITVQVAGPNQPPVAGIVVAPAVGLAGSPFQFDATGSVDPETPPANLQVRWDWENDGVWDTLWSTQHVRSHTYTDAGFHLARLEVRDGGGLTDAALRPFLVLPNVPQRLEVSPPGAIVQAGHEVQFRAEAWDAYDNHMRNPPASWSVLDPAAGTIDATGLFTAGLQSGAYPDAVVAAWSGVNDGATIVVFYPYHDYVPLMLRAW